MTVSQFDPRLVAYFGDPVLQNGFMPLPNLFLRHYADLGISTSQAMFLLQIMASTWDLGSPPATLSQVAARMGISRRGAQLISRDLHARGVIMVYDQFDATGRQTENAFDLSPLFARLAALAPTAAPTGQPRQRRSRAQPGADIQATQFPPAHVPSDPVVQPHASMHADTAPTGSANSTSQGSANSTSSSPGTGIRTSPEVEFAGSTNPGSRLKKEPKKEPKTSRRADQEQQHAAVAEGQVGKQKPGPVIVTEAGRSLRFGSFLDANMIAQRRTILARIGINADAADGAAPALAPEECWALWLHARVAGLGPAWIANQIYDRRQRQPRLAGIPRQYDHPGRLLAHLPTPVADALLDHAEQQWTRGAITPWLIPSRSDLPPFDDMDALSGALEAIAQAVTAEQRHQVAPGSAGHHGAHAAGHTDPRWDAARRRLAGMIPPADFETWIAPVVPVSLSPDATVLGVPNVFVRGQLQGLFAEALVSALRAELCYDAPIEIILDATIVAFA